MSKIHPIDEPRCKSAKLSKTESEFEIYNRDAVSLPEPYREEDAEDVMIKGINLKVHSESRRTSYTGLSTIFLSQSESRRVSVQSHASVPNQNESSVQIEPRDEVLPEIPLVYEPIIQKCKSAIPPMSEVENVDKRDTISLPGHLDEYDGIGLELAESPQQNQEVVAVKGTSADSGFTSSDSDCVVKEKGQQQDEESTKLPADNHQDLPIADNDYYSRCYSELSISIPETQSKEHIVETSGPSSPLRLPSSSSNHFVLPRVSKMRRRTNSKRANCGSCMGLFGHILLSLFVYPFVIFLLPFLLLGKLMCCMPCIRCYLGKENHTIPLYFAQRSRGTFCTVVAILKERIEPHAFEQACISSLNDAYAIDRTGIVLKLASKLKKIACFLRWKNEEKLHLDKHIVTLDRKVTTNKDFSFLLEYLSNQRMDERLWTVYFVPRYKGTQSAMIIRVHQSIASGSNIRNVLYALLPNNKPEQLDLEDSSISTKPSILKAVIKVPGVFLKRMKLGRGPRLTGKSRFDFSAPFFLKQAHQIVNAANCSLDALFLGCLAHSYRKFYTCEQKSSDDFVFAIPETFDASSSAFFVKLPMSRRQSTFESILQKMDDQILSKSEDAFILNVAAKMSSVLFSRAITNLFARSVIKGATGIFVLIDCTSEPLFIEHHLVKSILSWPPLYQKFKMAVVVLCYQNTFRICVVTDQAECEWPNVILDNFLSAFRDMHYYFSHN